MNDTPPSSRQADPAASPSAAQSGASRWPLALLLLAIGALAGGTGSLVVHATRDLFQVPSERLGMPPRPPAIQREMTRYAVINHAIGFGSLGIAICGALGLTLGVISRSAAAAIGGFGVGVTAGAVLGAVGGIAAWGMYELLDPVPLDGLFRAMLIHLPNWLLLATALTLAAAVALRPRPALQQLFVSALLGGAAAAVLYPIVGLILFPADASDRPIPLDAGIRILCFAMGGAALGLVIGFWRRPAASSLPAA